jgi:hypothetical protein
MRFKWVGSMVYIFMRFKWVGAMVYISAKHAALRSKCKSWLALHQNNVSEWGGLSANCCFSKLALWKSNSVCWSRTNGHSYHLIKCTCSRHDMATFNKDVIWYWFLYTFYLMLL